MATSTMLHVRVDENVKNEATATLAAMGLTVSDAVRIFLLRVIADKQMPFLLQVPNLETRNAMIEADELAKARSMRLSNSLDIFDDLEKNIGK
jgi:DNA-damage-inducible protein J